jgi:hypothetical protein
MCSLGMNVLSLQLQRVANSRDNCLWFFSGNAVPAAHPYLLRARVQASDVDTLGVGIIRQQ